jgi:hypothetical protein
MRGNTQIPMGIKKSKKEKPDPDNSQIGENVSTTNIIIANFQLHLFPFKRKMAGKKKEITISRENIHPSKSNPPIAVSVKVPDNKAGKDNTSKIEKNKNNGREILPITIIHHAAIFVFIGRVGF